MHKTAKREVTKFKRVPINLPRECTESCSSDPDGDCDVSKSCAPPGTAL
jgi:hypothetical protein